MAEPGGRHGDEHPGRRARRDSDRDLPPAQIALVEDPNRLHWARAFFVATSIFFGLILLAVLAVLVITDTDWGRERVRRVAQNWVNEHIHGEARIGRISGNLLIGMTLHNVSITDSAGNPFVAVESFRGNYSILALFRKRISVDRAVAVRPVVVLDHPPVGHWNWQNIFPRDTTPKPASEQTKWGDWLRFTNGTVIGGQLIVRSPWHPNRGLSARARDSAISEALRGRGRLLIRRAPGGYQKIVQLDTVSATIPLLRLSQPGVKNRLLEVSAATMTAYPFRPPAANVRDLKGIFPFNNDSVWWKDAHAAFPKSKVHGDGIYNFETGDLALTMRADPAAFTDMRWVYPRLPAEGRGAFNLKLAWVGALQDYQLTNMTVALGPARASGKFGITLDDTITIHNTDLRFSDIETRTLEQLIPHLRSPRRGTLSGRGIVSGGRNFMSVSGDVTFRDVSAGTSRITAVGGVGFPGNGMRASDLRLRLLPVQVAMARTWYPTLPIAGTVSGTATLNGSTVGELRIIANVDHRDRGTFSALDGTATVHLGGASGFVVDGRARPASLVEVGRFFPSAGLHGSVVGPFHLSGTARNLNVRGDFTLPDGGRFAARGTLDIASPDVGYDLVSQLAAVNLSTVLSRAPRTRITANVVAKGRGVDPATMQGAVAADFKKSSIDSIGVDTASVKVNIGHGTADLATLYVGVKHTVARASGTFGITHDHAGEIKFNVAADSLGVFNRWLPKSATTQAVVAPRPGVTARIFARARSDSARRARSTEMQRLISGQPPPRLVVSPPKPVAGDTISGSAFVAGTVSGNIYDFTLQGRAGGTNVNIRGNYARAFKSEFAWRNARTPTATLAVALDADSLSVMGFAFDSLLARVSYRTPGGQIQLAVIEDQQRRYSAMGDYALFPAQKQLKLTDMKFQFDTVAWTLMRPSLITWGAPGVRVADFELRNRGAGRLYANGLLPTAGSADFRLELDNFPLSNIVDITQTDVNLAGLLMLHGNMTGSLSAPVFKGAFGIVNGAWNATKVPDVRGTFSYANELLISHAEALRKTGEVVTTADAQLPLNLAVTGVSGDRLLPRPMAVDITGDSLPIDLIPQMTDVVSNVHGHAAGRIAMRGTLRRPSLTGALLVDNATMTISSTGATIESINGFVRMLDDTVYVDSLAGWSKGPVRVKGTLAVGDWREPTFNLSLISSGAELLNNKWGKVRVDANASLTGPFQTANLNGNATVTQGVIYAPEPTGQHVIGAGDPALFNVLDTALASDRELFPSPSPLLANLKMEVTLGIRHNTWVRNREANVEIYTDDPLIIHSESEAFDITGVVSTDRGEYNFLSRRFQIKRGSALFIGSPDVNPTLQITGEYQVQTAARGAINIRVSIGGTLRKPKLSLESDAQPPRTQSELLTLLAFGQSTTSLLGSASSSIAGSAATTELFGVGAQYAVRRLAGVALGVAVDQVEMQAGRAFGTDVFDITPGDVPSGNFVGNFLTQTKIEAGKYINPRTFVTVQTQASLFGAGIEHRTADGWTFNASVAPRILLLEPQLNSQPIRTVTAWGGFIMREWRF